MTNNRNLYLGLLAVLLAVLPAAGELTVHYEFEGTLANSAGSQYPGVLVDGALGGHDYVAGVMGQALRLSHTSGDPGPTGNDFVRIDTVLPDTGSMAFWYRPTPYYNYQTVFDNAVQADDWELWIYNTGVARFRIQAGTEVSATLPAWSETGDNWHHFAVTWTRAGAQVESRLYLDGALTEQRTGPWVNPGAAVYLGGGHPGNDAGVGAWDDFRIYDHALDSAEIRWLARQVVVAEPTLLLIDEGQSGTLSVRLEFPSAEEPAHQVAVTLSGDAGLSYDDRPAGQERTLLFLPGQMTQTRTIAVTPRDDLVKNETRIIPLTLTAASAAPHWSGLLSTPITVVVADDDPACGDWGYSEMDFDRDCQVDLRDLVEFATQWLVCTDPGLAPCLPAGRYPVAIVAHRGYSAVAPENTIASCLASRGYANGVEYDVRTDAGGELVIMHDNTVDRTTRGDFTGPVENLTRAQWSTLDAGSWFDPRFAGEPLPTLPEVLLAVHPDMISVVERKTGTPEQFVKVFQALRLEQELVVIAFDWEFLAQLERLMPGIRTGALGSDALTLETIEALKAQGIDFIDWGHDAITAETVKLSEALGMDLWVWTVDDANRMRALIGMGVKGITTNDPRLLQSVLTETGR